MNRNRTLAVIVALIALPSAFALFNAMSFHIANRNNGVIVSSGVKREYLLYVPASYDGAKPAPLVISLHGAGGWPAQQMETSEWNRLADQEGFIVVYPAGAEDGGPRIWHVERGPALARDVRFIADLIEKLERDYDIDRHRIYVNGLSNGGGMSFALSCAMSDRIAAAGLVGAAQTLPFSWCTDRHAVPMIAFHGTDDPVVPYNGGVSWLTSGLFPNVPMWAAKWAHRNGCEPTAHDARVANDVMRREFTRCTNDASVVLYTVRGGGHTWPGGKPLPEWLTGRTTNSIDATRQMWTFFRAHPLRMPE